MALHAIGIYDIIAAVPSLLLALSLKSYVKERGDFIEEQRPPAEAPNPEVRCGQVDPVLMEEQRAPSPKEQARRIPICPP